LAVQTFLATLNLGLRDSFPNTVPESSRDVDAENHVPRNVVVPSSTKIRFFSYLGHAIKMLSNINSFSCACEQGFKITFAA
jgi:hypothetical protein